MTTTFFRKPWTWLTRFRDIFPLVTALFIIDVARSQAVDLPEAPDEVLSGIQARDLLRHASVLASDEFEGRAPGTAGEERSIAYLADVFRELGLKPAGTKESYVQEVPMVGIQSSVAASIRFSATNEILTFPQDFVAWSPRVTPRVHVRDSELIFVGYGVEAPEYEWDDYKGFDVRGKTLVMLINDPPVPDPESPERLDARVFKGRAMTYYGRWTYKFEVAARKGAAAAVIIHETGPAGYPYFVVVNSWSRENFDLDSPNAGQDKVAVASWMSLERARSTLKACGRDLDVLKAAARRRDFRPVPLGARIDFGVTNAVRTVTSHNVIARLDGSDPARRHEHVVYTAHWDHLGRDPRLEGDQIYNGAVDNATGTAALLDIAEAFVRLPHKPRRSILFVGLTGEEQGLLGALHFVRQPPVPVTRIVANLNMDAMAPWGRTSDVSIVGSGNNTLEDLVHMAAAKQGRTVKPDAEPEKGSYYRSDHFEFAKVGVPALYLKSGLDLVDQPPGRGKERSDDFTARDYHKVSDEVRPDWDLAGAAEDARLMFWVGYAVAQADRWPQWLDTSEFKPRRPAPPSAGTP